MKTYGRVTYSEAFGRAAWMIEAEPHVMMRLKRVFKQIDKTSKGKVFLSDTIENAREIEWFLERFPMEIDAGEYLAVQAERHRQRDEAVERIMNSEYLPPPGIELAVPLRSYQITAAAIARATGRLLVADDVGLGKSATAIGMLEPDKLPALVVTLTHLTGQWQREISRFAPALSVHVATKGKAYPLDKGKQGDFFGEKPRFPDVVVMNYHKLAGWDEALAPIVKTVIFDECQELRRKKSAGGITAKYAAASFLSSKAVQRVGLSATPIYNYGGEIHNVMECIAPGELGTWSEFRREWCGGGSDEKVSISNPKAFGTFMRDRALMLRRSRRDVGRELPPLSKVPQYVDSDTAALDNVKDAATELAHTILRQTGEPRQRGDEWRASEQLSNILRQATGIAKAPYVSEFVRLLVESGERVVLYGWHRAVYDLWNSRLRDLDPVMFTGSETPKQKDVSRHKFLRGDSPVMIISLRAGAGLDGLQGAARTIVFGEIDWSPAVHEQCIGRVYRDGQKDPCVAYFLISETGSDPIVADVLGIKRRQSDGIRSPDGEIYQGITDTEISKRLARAFLEQRGIETKGEPEHELRAVSFGG